MTSPYWKRRPVWGWVFYDFANSAFATTISAVIFNVYFVQQVVPPTGVVWGGMTIPGASLWSYTVSFSMFLVFLISPLLGAVADSTGSRKKFLAGFWLLGCLSTLGLFFVQPGDVALGAGLYILGNLGFSGSLAFYNSFLPSLCSPKTMGRVSGLGWAVGYAGGGLCLALNLWMIKSPETFGLSPENFLPVRTTFLTVGLWWFFFSLPFFRWVGDVRPPGMSPPGALACLSLGWKRLRDTVQNIRRYGNLLRFLAAYLVYNDGIETIILMASLVGAGLLGMSPDELVLCFLMIQGVAFVGALAFGWLADRIRHKPVLFIALALYGGCLLWAAQMSSPREFWILGVVVGLVLGGSQAASRSWMGLLTPPEKSAEFFSFFGVVGKLTAVLGPLVFGLITQVWGMRPGILSLMVFFALGALLLAFVKEEVID
jgi:UMF1 family MFS transporter